MALRIGAWHHLELHEVRDAAQQALGLLLVCTRCGAYTKSKGKWILRPCLGEPQVHLRRGLQRQCWRIARGLHPSSLACHRYCTITAVQALTVEQVREWGRSRMSQEENELEVQVEDHINL
eukprot:4435411-Amphidinium_carterae.1